MQVWWGKDQFRIGMSNSVHSWSSFYKFVFFIGNMLQKFNLWWKCWNTSCNWAKLGCPRTHGPFVSSSVGALPFLFQKMKKGLRFLVQSEKKCQHLVQADRFQRQNCQNLIPSFSNWIGWNDRIFLILLCSISQSCLLISTTETCVFWTSPKKDSAFQIICRNNVFSCIDIFCHILLYTVSNCTLSACFILSFVRLVVVMAI